jgi:FG-GAP repeat protein
MRTRSFGKTMIGGLSAAVLLSAAVVASAGPASAAACDSGSDIGRADIDGDGSADAAVGMPWYADGSGAVDLRFTGSPSVLLRSGALGAGTGEGDGFGAAVAVGDLDGDGCADLVVGAPAEGQSDASDGAGGNEGQVHLVFGKAGGVDLTSSIVLPHDSNGQNLDHFGEEIALVTRWDDAASRNVHDLYVAAPRAIVAGHAEAGEVFQFTIAPSATGRVTSTLRKRWTQNSAGVPGSAENCDGFGTVLAATDLGGVLVGAPNENVGSVRDAGTVWFLRVNAAGAAITSQAWSQNSPGVSGSAEIDDHFGSALGSRGLAAAVGVPDENSGSKANSGMIQTFSRNAGGGLTPRKGITQDSAGIPGGLEAGDRFGAQVAAGAALLCQESDDVAVGAPGEDIGSRKDAGGITLISLTSGSGCPAKALRQGSGLAGAAETGDAVGSVLGTTRRQEGLDEDYSDRLLVGVPLEDIGANSDAGIVQPTKGGITVNGSLKASLQFSKGYLLADHYGMVLSTGSNS